MTITFRKAALGALAAASAAVLFAGCAQPPADNGDGGDKKADFLPCMVSDSGGFDDASFNQLSFEGMTSAAEELDVSYKKVESQTPNDFEPNVNSLVDQGCNLIITVGFLLKDATEEAAKANEDVHFAIVDDNQIDLPNVKPIIYDTAQAAFLAGYASASYSKTGIVGTFGGMNIPTVTIFMDGFADGVAYFNEKKGKDVKVLGWDVAAQDGSFTGGFEANETAKNTAQALIDQNADVIMPVGGPIYKSAAEAIREANKAGKDVVMLGVDADVFESDPSVGELLLTSVMKGMKPSVNEVVKNAANGKFDNTPYVGTLENDGVGIAPFHDYADKVSPELKDELDAIKKGIIDGSIKVESPSSPQ